jgi:hypothetical protein
MIYVKKIYRLVQTELLGGVKIYGQDTTNIFLYEI